MSAPSKAVFLSYASQDADAARRICEALRTAGLEVWFDQSELRGGDAWDTSIRKQVKECALFVPLISANTDSRSEGYFRLEWKLAVDRSHLMADDQPFLLPVVIDDTLEASARVPDRFRERQWTRLRAGEAAADFAERATRLLSGGRVAAVASDPAQATAHSASAPADEGFRVAVLPLKYRGADADLTALSEALSEEIVTGLSRFSYIRVIAHSSSLRYTSEVVDMRAAGKELGARYVMEGSLRQAGTKLRIAVQLVDATTGAHLWAENYERTFRRETVFELQDELVPRIVSTIADMNGVLPRSMSATLRGRDPAQLSPYEAVLRSFGYFERLTPEDLASALAGLEVAVRKSPASADAWAMLALLCVQDYAQGFNLQPDSLTSGLIAARRALEAAPSNPLAYFGLAQAHFFQKEFQSLFIAAERAVALNPMDGNSIAFLGELLSYAGNWERGIELAARAKELNPHHPGFYWFADFFNSYRQSDYSGALRCALKLNLPGHYGAQTMLAAAYGQLGQRDLADKALRDLLKLRPDFAATIREVIAKWWDPEYGEHLLDGLRKAGLEIAPANAATASATFQRGNA